MAMLGNFSDQQNVVHQNVLTGCVDISRRCGGVQVGTFITFPAKFG